MPVFGSSRKRNPADSSISDFLRDFEARFPFGPRVRRFFRTAECDPIYASPIPDEINGPGGSWYLLVRLTPSLEERFGLTREFVVYCTTVTDLQSRAVPQIKRLMQVVNRPVEREFAVIVTDDEKATEKVRDWSLERSEGITLISMTRSELELIAAEENASLVLPRVFDNWLFTRNLYDERTPVTGYQFFGREEALGQLERTIKEGRHSGIFGLRKIGKTSLLRELQLRCRLRANLRVAVVDLQASSSAPSAGQIAHRIGRQVVEELFATTELARSDIRRDLDLPQKWSGNGPREMIDRVCEGLAQSLTEGLLEGTNLALVLDEAEILLPASQAPLPEAVELLRGLRGVAQETQALTLIVAGVNAHPLEAPTLGAHDNPIFQFMVPSYLGPLSDESCQEMIRRIGRKMGVRWEADAMQLIIAEVGGHPLLARLAAADVTNLHHERPCRLTLLHVRPVLKDFHRVHGSVFKEMTDSLRRYYGEELEILRLVVAGERQAAREWRDEFPDAVNHLVGYGVLDPDWMSVRVPVLERWLKENG